MDKLTSAEVAIDKAIVKLSETCPNERDYPGGGFYMAVNEHTARVQKLTEVAKELDRMFMGILDQASRKS
jgi:hypothetical protein